MTRPTVFIRHRFEHMGAHSGYDLLVPPLLTMLPDTHSIFVNETIPPAWANRVLSSVFYRLQATPFYKRENLWAELRALAWRPLGGKLVHVLYGEDNLGILARRPFRPGTKVVVTLHQPLEWWHRNGLNPTKLLDGVDAVIVLSQSEARAFGAVTRTPVHFVPHGIDVDFFAPHASGVPTMRQSNTPRCVFVGNWLRDFKTLHDVVARLGRPDIAFGFDVVTPEKADRSAEDAASLAALVTMPGVTWHRGVNDDELRALYRGATLLLLPLRESTANNAVLEAMACGVPVVTNVTSGIADYTAADYAMVVAAADAEAMASAVLQIVSSPEIRRNMAASARQRAMTDFSWAQIATQVRSIYSDLEHNIY